MNSFSQVFAENGVVPIVHDIVDIESEAITSAKGAAGYRIMRRYAFRLYASDGTFVEGKMDGEAIDYGDKCTTKAQSVAYREFLFKTFCVAFEGDNDIENASHELKKVEYACQKCGAANVNPHLFPSKFKAGMQCFKCSKCDKYTDALQDAEDLGHLDIQSVTPAK